MSDQSFSLEPEWANQDIIQEAEQLLAGLDANGNYAILLAGTSPSVPISEEFADLCIQMRTTPRPDVLIVLRQMQSILDVLPVSLIIQNPNFLTLRSLLEIALETQTVTPRLRCFAFGMSYLQSVAPSLQSTGSVADPGDQERFSEAQSEIVIYFLLEPRRPRTSEQIADAIWPNKDLVRAQQAFHTARHRLRNFAGEDVILVMKRGHYLLNPDLPVWFDVAEFENLYARVQSILNPLLRIRMLESAVALYRGDFLEKNYKDWTVPTRNQLRTKYISAMLQLGLLYERENATQAIACYDKLLHTDPLNEDGYFHLIALYVARGEHIAAQRTWLLCCETFLRELGNDPSPTLLERIAPFLAKMGLTVSANSA